MKDHKPECSNHGVRDVAFHVGCECRARELDRQAPGEWGGYEAFEQFLAAEIDSAPEALRRLGEWLGNVLDEDHFATANRLVLGAMLETSDAIRKVAASKAAPQPPAQEQGEGLEFFTAPEGLHPETLNLIARFAGALAAKLAEAERKYGWVTHWQSPAWMDQCREQLVDHVAKGDPRDVAAYCAFLWHHGEPTALTRAAGAEDAREAEVFKEGWEYGYWHGQQTPNGYSNPSDCQADWHEYKQQREAAIASQAKEGEK